MVGKFYPPHKGHSYLIDYGLARVNELDVLVCDHPSIKIPAKARQEWLQTIHPTANVRIIPDIEDDDNSPAWAEHTISFLGYAPDIVFSSEDYGDPYARCMGCQHQLVDKARVTIPISGTKVRADVIKSWQHVHPVVRKHYARRVCVLGAESTGTTTLSRALANHYKTAWVPEYGRYYTQSLNDPNHQWHSQEFTHIAAKQQAIEHQLAGESSGLLICDTNAFATRLWHRRYMGEWSKAVDKIAQQDKPELYILTGDEIPFVQDGIRDGEHVRHGMHQDFKQELGAIDTPYIEVMGTIDQRLAHATKAIDNLLQRKVTI